MRIDTVLTGGEAEVMTMRKAWMVVAVASLALLSMGVVQPRVDQYRDVPLDRQNVGEIRSAHTFRTTFVPIANWGFSDGPGIRARGGVAVTVSLTIKGGPIDLRVLTEAPNREWVARAMKPGTVRMDPGAGKQSFSYTFVTAVPPGPYTVNLFWRSPTGADVQLTAGSVVIQYAGAV
jgi:hypothetical protein